MGGGASLPIPVGELGPDTVGQYPQGVEGKNPHFSAHIDDPKAIVFGKSGPASEKECPSRTLIDVLLTVEKRSGHLPALRTERPCPALGPNGKAPPALSDAETTKWTYGEYIGEARQAAAGMIALGMNRFDCTCIFAFNCPEWHLSSIAALLAGGCFTGIYPSDTAEQVRWKALVTNTAVAVAENAKAVEKFLTYADELSHLKAIVVLEPGFSETTHTRTDGSTIKLLGWDSLKEIGKGQENLVEERMKMVRPTDCADLIFTSGTTGNPKAVMISHDNLVFEANSMLNVMSKLKTGPTAFRVDTQHRILSYLPLSHIAGSLVDIFLPLMMTEVQEGKHGMQVTFARAYDLKVGSLVDRLQLTRPTIFLGVPRVWEKIHEKLMIVGKSIKGIKRKVADKCKATTLAFAREQQLGGNGKIPFGYGFAKGKVLGKILQKLGLDQCQIGYSGAAPLKKVTQCYFASIGILINEVYGMSETAGVATMTTSKTFTWGSVGFALPGLEVEVFQVDPNDINKKVKCPKTADLFNPKPEEEGEICFRGRSIMIGYMCNPALGEEHVREIYKKNADVIDNDGWLHSGDKGCKDINEMMRVTGRFKELIIGAGGENISPVPIEDDILKNCPLVSNIIMIGDERKFNIACIALKCDGATGELPGSQELDKDVLEHCSEGVKTIAQAAEDPKVIETIMQAIMQTNKNGAVCPSNASKIQKFTILPHDLSVATGELTATLKLKRSVTEKKHIVQIDSMYELGAKDFSLKGDFSDAAKGCYVPYPGIEGYEYVKEI